MNAPFMYGRVISGDYFINREEEIKKMINSFKMGTNIILISPRRWGKSSLVYHAVERYKQKEKKAKVIFLDLFNTRTEEQFYELLAKQTLKAFAGPMEDILEFSRNLLSRFVPKITFNPTPESDFVLSMDWEEIKRNPSDILNLAEKLAFQHKCKVVICIDEFQNLSFFEDPVSFQKKLRAHWQLQKQVSYCLYGSKRNMMINVFTSPDMPFYKFGDIIHLDKIKSDEWHKYVRQQFNKSDKNIDDKALENITILTHGHPFYVQQLAQQAWLRTKGNCTESVVMDAFEDMVRQASMLFNALTDNLGTLQINFLRALTENISQLSSKETLNNYRLGTSANVQRIKQALMNKEIIDISGEQIYLLDPLYTYWLKNHYFGSKGNMPFEAR